MTGDAAGLGGTKVGGALQLQAVQQGHYDYSPVVKVETMQQGNITLKIPPQTSLTDGGPWLFNLPSMESHALDMRSLETYWKTRIVHTNGRALSGEPDYNDDWWYEDDDNDPKTKRTRKDVDPLTAFDVVAPINLLNSAMIQTCDISLNTRPLPSESGQHTNYKAYMEAVQSYSNDARQTHLATQFFQMDDAHQMDRWEVHTDSQNSGFLHRWQRVEGSRIFEFMGPLHHPFLRSNNHLASTNTLSIRAQRPSDQFLLFTKKLGAQYKIEILELCLYATYIRLPENYKPPDTQVYLYNDSVLRQTVLPAGTPSAVIPITNHDELLPQSLVFGMTKTTSVNGSYETYPWLFEHFGMNELCLIRNGTRFPNNPLTFDFTNQFKPLIMRAYRWMFRNSGMLRADRGNSISLAAFGGGSLLIPFDLSPDQCNQTHEHNARRAKLEIEVKFKETLRENVTVHYLMTRRKALILDAKTGNFDIVEVKV